MSPLPLKFYAKSARLELRVEFTAELGREEYRDIVHHRVAAALVRANQGVADAGHRRVIPPGTLCIWSMTGREGQPVGRGSWKPTGLFLSARPGLRRVSPCRSSRAEAVRPLCAARPPSLEEPPRPMVIRAASQVSGQEMSPRPGPPSPCRKSTLSLPVGCKQSARPSR